MNFTTILIWTVIVVVIYFIIRYLMLSDNLSSLESAKNEQKISSTSLVQNENAANFTYSIWFYINDWNYRYGEEKIIYARLDENNEPSPSVSLDSLQNDVLIKMSTYPSSDKEMTSMHTCRVKNVPIQKWVNLIVSVYGRSLDVYIDGKLVRTCILPGVPKVVNEKDLFITPNGGFSGFTSKFAYFKEASNPQQAWNIYKKGYGSAIFSVFDKYRVDVSLFANNEKQGSFSI